MNNVSDTKYTSIDEVIKKSTITDHQGNQVDVVNRISRYKYKKSSFSKCKISI